MTAARPGDELREVIAEALLTCLRDGNPLYYEDAADECADTLLPVVTAWAERHAQERAAEERARWQAVLDVSPQLANDDGTHRGYLVSDALVSALTADGGE